MIEYLTKRMIIENEVFNQIIPRIKSEGEFENEVFNQIVPRKKSKTKVEC